MVIHLPLGKLTNFGDNLSLRSLKCGYSVRLGSGQPEFDSLQRPERYIFFFCHFFIFCCPNNNDFKRILLRYILITFISLLSSDNCSFVRSKLITEKKESHGQNSRLCITILLVKFRAIIYQSLKLSAFLFIYINKLSNRPLVRQYIRDSS